jgi:hypothetical protein
VQFEPDQRTIIMKIYSVPAIISASLLTACGGTSTPVETAVIPPIVALTQTDLIDDGNRLLDAYLEDFNKQEFTAFSDIPTTGTATYTGVIGVGVPEVATGGRDAQLIGQLNLGVSFAADDNQIKGTASNFYNAVDDEKLTGTLALDASIVDTTGQFDGNISGRLTQFDPIDVNIDVTGGFLGTGTTAIAGSGTGQVLSLDNGQMFDAGIIIAAD